MLTEAQVERRKALRKMEYELLLIEYFKFVRYMLVNTELNLPDGLSHPLVFVEAWLEGKDNIQEIRARLHPSYTDFFASFLLTDNKPNGNKFPRIVSISLQLAHSMTIIPPSKDAIFYFCNGFYDCPITPYKFMHNYQ